MSGAPHARPRSGARRAGRGRAVPAAAGARRIRRATPAARESAGLHRGRESTPRAARPCALLGPSGARQDDARAYRRARDGGRLSRHLRPGHSARRRSRGGADQSAAARRPVHRRDPSAGAVGRGDPLSGDGGLSARPDHRRRACGALDTDRSLALYPGRGDDPVGADHPAAARAFRHSATPRFLRACRTRADPHPCRASAGL